MLVAALLAVAVPAGAQTRPAAQAPATPGRAKELTVGGTWFGPVSMGSASAELLTPSGSGFTLFETENSLGQGLGLSVGFGFAVSRALTAEVAGGWSRANLQTDVTGDFEAADIEPVRSSVNRFTLEGAMLWYFKPGGATSWFLRGSGGWAVELPEGNALAEDGFLATGGVGVRHWWRRDARGRGRTGFRALGGFDIRSGGLALDDGSIRFAPMASFSVVFGF